jgi:hypothetical protein
LRVRESPRGNRKGSDFPNVGAPGERKRLFWLAFDLFLNNIARLRDNKIVRILIPIYWGYWASYTAEQCWKLPFLFPFYRGE